MQKVMMMKCFANAAIYIKKFMKERKKFKHRGNPFKIGKLLVWCWCDIKTNLYFKTNV